MSSRLGDAMSATTFYAVAAVGIAVALVLTVVEVGREPAIGVEVRATEREGGVSVVEARAVNATDEPRCPEIRVAARDTDGADLDEVVAAPVDDSGRIEPERSARYRAELTGIDEQEHLEELEEYSAYVWEDRPCE